ncbi:MAG TPA: OmpA family protein, partial [Burkholderiaceae bacterium]|nr:OmpA family protein [Burkholderiaceae bacterium]
MRRPLAPLVRLALGLLLPAVAIAQTAPAKDDAVKPGTQKIVTTPSLGQTVEKQLDPDAQLTPWKLDENTLPPLVKERTENQEVLEKNVRTIKVQNLLPPIYFESGKANISNEYVDKVREILEGMKDRRNVRLHLVGHTDNVQLFGETRIQYVDNDGLSRERAGVAAEFFQKALSLPPESVTYEGRGEREPVASNASEA